MGVRAMEATQIF